MRLGPAQTIIVFRALQLGDMLCAVPALRGLRHAYPQSHIALVGLPWAAAFAERFSHYIDEFVAFPGYPGLPEIEPKISELPAFLSALQKRNFDAAIQLHGSGSYVNSITMLLGAKVSAGFYVPGEYCPDPLRFMPWPDELPEVDRYLALLNFLAPDEYDCRLEFPLLQQDQLALEALGLDLAQPYAIVHPGAQLPSRRWPPEHFAAVADTLASRGLNVILTGSAQERPLAERVTQHMRRRATDLAGKTSLGALAVLLRGARLLVSNDTGLSHIAAALEVPSVIACLASDARRWAPANRALHKVVESGALACRPCVYRECPIGHPCAQSVTVAAMLEAIDSHLGTVAGRVIPVYPQAEDLH